MQIIVITFQRFLSDQGPPLSGVQLMASGLGLVFDHVAPGAFQRLRQSRTHPRDMSHKSPRIEPTHRAIVPGQLGRRKDLRTDIQLLGQGFGRKAINTKI